MFKGPVGPQSGRTGRSQAESIGTDAEGFKADPPYDHAGGHPITKDLPAGTYAERPMSPPKGAASPSDPSPFNLTR